MDIHALEEGAAAAVVSWAEKDQAILRRSRRGAPGRKSLLAALAALGALTGALECRPVGHRSYGPWPVAVVDRPSNPPKRWSWPTSPAFQGAASMAGLGATTIRVVRGRVVRPLAPALDGVTVALAPTGDTFDAWLLLAGGNDRWGASIHPESGWILTSGSLDRPWTGELELSVPGTRETLRIESAEVRRGGPPHPAALADWTYVAALLGEGDTVYEEKAGDLGDADEGIAAAIARGDQEGALSIYRRFRPRGACSMDERPARVARAYADLCFDVGRLGCFLQLQVQIMGDRFDRVAYSSYGEASHATEADKLADTGVDVERFFRGLTIQLAGVKRRGELGTWRLARSIKESGSAGSILPAIATMAADPGLDEHNRLRAAQVVVMATDDEEAIAQEDLADSARAWLDERRAEAAKRR
jgi:hypothetical protein